MTITSDYLGDETAKPTTAPQVRVRSLLRRLSGWCLLLAATGLWLAPGTNWDSEMVLMKLGVSFFFALTGLTLVFARTGRDTLR